MTGMSYWHLISIECTTNWARGACHLSKHQRANTRPQPRINSAGIQIVDHPDANSRAPPTNSAGVKVVGVPTQILGRRSDGATAQDIESLRQRLDFLFPASDAVVVVDVHVNAIWLELVEVHHRSVELLLIACKILVGRRQGSCRQSEG